MKKLITLVLVCFCIAAGAQPFYRKTKHKTVKTMSRSEVRKVQKGVNMYTRQDGVVRKNTFVVRLFSKPAQADVYKQSKSHQKDWKQWEESGSR